MKKFIVHAVLIKTCLQANIAYKEASILIIFNLCRQTYYLFSVVVVNHVQKRVSFSHFFDSTNAFESKSLYQLRNQYRS